MALLASGYTLIYIAFYNDCIHWSSYGIERVGEGDREKTQSCGRAGENSGTYPQTVKRQSQPSKSLPTLYIHLSCIGIVAITGSNFFCRGEEVKEIGRAHV